MRVEEFEREIRAGREVTEPVRMTLEVEDVEKAADGSRELTFTISTSSVDRAGDTVAIDGWDLENYMKNPVVLFAHDHRSLPIARAKKIWKHAGKLKATAEFVPGEVYPFAETVYQMYAKRFMRATSVGFRAKKYKMSDDEERKKRWGIDFLEQELLEFSMVPVPANAEALLEAKSAGLDIAPMLAGVPGLAPGLHVIESEEPLSDMKIARIKESLAPYRERGYEFLVLDGGLRFLRNADVPKSLPIEVDTTTHSTEPSERVEDPAISQDWLDMRQREIELLNML
jgi:HK97 family phage prohead protease